MQSAGYKDVGRGVVGFRDAECGDQTYRDAGLQGCILSGYRLQVAGLQVCRIEGCR